MEKPFLKAEVREGFGKEKAKKLRVKGTIPAIFYGPRTKSIPITVDPKALGKTLQTEAGENVLIDLDIHEGDQSNRHVVMLKDLQVDTLKRTILHADFYEVAMNVMVTVEVPINLVGKPEGTKMGGILEQVARMLEVQCLPANIPNRIDVDVTSLMIGDSIHVGDLQVENAKVLSDRTLTIATVVPPVAEEKPAEVAAAAEVTEEAAEAEPKEAEEEEK